jgi:heme-degrading monooxygenase HmoA
MIQKGASMSVIVMGRIDIEPHVMKKLMEERADDFLAVEADSRSKGCLHHQFVVAGNEVGLVDEWETAEQFEQFFANQATIGEIMQAGGATAPPKIAIYEVLPSPDRF